jgi:hypothetical protein
MKVRKRSRMFEQAEVDRLLVRLNGPGDGMVLFYVHPAYEVVLKSRQSTLVAAVAGEAGMGAPSNERQSVRVQPWGL